ncbi:glycosyltransferase family 2 protein [Acidicapsa ligni]|uniref:glycosyltransferase family 2 protein n=1 Tax=Acidicapsa ligni TaxID=542300 RepID=UPI0021DF5AD4|nr:glycosyltransferase [Acidicapsa ligni]
MSTPATTIELIQPDLSVVIIGRNEGERLERCILSAQSIEGWSAKEILYVDSGSTDGSLELAAKLGARVLPLPPGPFTAARARNMGWQSATGKLILFLDGDTILNADFPVAALAELEKNATNAAAWGHRRELCECLSIYVRVLDLDWVYPPGETLFFGGDVLVRRAALEAVNGFDETLIAGEEPEMCRRMRNLGWHIQHIDVQMTLHDLAITRFSQYWRRSQRAGYAFASVSSRFRGTSDPFWSDEARRNRQRGLFWLLSPIVALILSAILLSLWPFMLWILLLFALAVRTARQYRWKPASWTTLLLYGFHSHLQQIPIFFGQLQFLMNGNKALMEYKDVTPIPEHIETRQP